MILAGTHTVKICGEIPTDKTEVSADELDKILRSHVKELYGEYPFPAPFFLQPTTDGNDCFYPYKENPKGWATICPEFAPDYFVPFEGENEEELPLNAFMKFMTGGGMFEALGIGYAYVYLPVEEEFPYEKREVLEDWLIDYLKKTNEPGREFVLKVVGIVRTDAGDCMDMMIFDENGFFQAMRFLAPMLTGMKAKIVTVKGKDTMIYDAGYEIVPADGTIFS